MAGQRRYYSKKNIKILILIKSLLKEKGMTINGVKRLLGEKNFESIDDSVNFGVYKPTIKSTKIIKDKLKNISKIIKDLKNISNG